MMGVGFGMTVLARSLRTSGIDGIGRYTQELLKHLTGRADLSLLPLVFDERVPEVAGIRQRPMSLPAYAMGAGVSALTGLPFPGMRRLAGRVDLVHATDHLVPKAGKIPVVATLMDAIPISHPEWVSQRFKFAKLGLWKRAVRWAAHVITISAYSRDEIEAHFRISTEKISVIPLGVAERWFAPVPVERARAVTGRYELPDRFFLFVGTLQPRKNLERIIAAHRALPGAIREEAPLLIVGRPGWQCSEVVAALDSGAFGHRVRWLRHLPGEDLIAVVKAARALVLPSLYEGFGLPVLEAFAAGTPVITSNSTALPEVAADAALLVDPRDVTAIAAAMERLAEDDLLAQACREKGLVRAREYSWCRTAAMTADVYRQVLEAA